MLRTSYSVFIHFDMNSVPHEAYLDNMQWLNEQTKTAGLLLCKIDGSLARGQDFYQPPKHSSVQANEVFISIATCPRTNTFVEVALSATLFSTVTRLHRLDSESLNTSNHLTYEVKFKHPASALLAEDESNGDFFTRGQDKNIPKKQAMLAEKKKFPDVRPWDTVLMSLGIDLGSRQQRNTILSRPTIPFG